MATGIFSIANVDLDSIFIAGSGGATTGIRVAGADLNTRYAPYASGAQAATTGIRVGGADISTRFQYTGTPPVFTPTATPSLNGGTYTDSASAGFMQIQINNDGTLLAVGNNSGIVGLSNWGTPTTPGIGSSYWTKWTRNSFSGSGAATATSAVLSLASGQTFNVTAGGVSGTLTQANYTLQIFSNAGGTIQVAAATFTLRATQ